VSCDSGKRSFHDPTLGQHDESFRFDRTQHRLQNPAKCRVDPFRQAQSTIGAVGEHNLEAAALLAQHEQHKMGTFMVLPIRPMHDDRPDESLGVNRQVAFASSNLFPGVVTPFFASFGRPRGLAVDNRRRRLAPLAYALPHHPPQGIVNVLSHTRLTPPPKGRVHRSPLGKVPRQLAPLATRANHVQHRIQNLSTIERRPATLGALRQQGSNQLPLLVGKVAGIMSAHRHGSVFLDLITQGAES
jgi:hypothetical protein